MLPVLLLAGSLALAQPPKPQVTSHLLPAPNSLNETVRNSAQSTPPETPATPPSLNDCLKACPPAYDPAPFLRLPKLDPLGDCKDGGGCGTPVPRGDGLWRHVFTTAARFTVPRFGQGGEPAEADGVVIYEGMRLTVNPNTGVYDLSFTATTPPTPVTLRLQLLFHPPDRPDDAVRLTLPPIEIEPVPTTNELRRKANTVRVSHRGFSELFMPAGSQSESSDRMGKDQLPTTKTASQVASTWAVVRSGTARFGSAQTTNDDTGR